MPELPEVEVTVSELKKILIGLKIKDIWTDLKNLDRFRKIKMAVTGRKITAVRRRGKNILIDFAGNKTVLVHMKMTGHFLYPRKNFDRFVHVVFKLSNRKELGFSDLRKFGKIAILESDLELGPDALGKNFRVDNFVDLIRKKKGKIKQVLMNQEVIAGIGNIYSDEVLWQAGINPEQKTENIPSKKLKEIYQAVKQILKKAIKLKGDSTSDFKRIDGRPGRFQLYHRAYRRAGEKCGRRGCGGVIMKTVVNGRSAHFCSRHQK